jgi:hypothetical protein
VTNFWQINLRAELGELQAPPETARISS